MLMNRASLRFALPDGASLRHALTTLLALCLCVPLWGCGSDSTMGPPTPDPNEMPPPPPPPGGQYGSGSGGMVTPPPECPETRRRCATTFAYAGSAAMPLSGKEASVEVRGDFNSWQPTTPMAYDAASKSWKASVALPLGGMTQYKFHIIYMDKTESWVPDPSNPDLVDDGFGGKNSRLMNITCTMYTCGDAVTMCRVPAPKGYDWRDAVIYFVFVDRFLDGNPANNRTTTGVDTPGNWQGGDWAGVTQKIKDGYFNDLGVNTLWITVPMDNTDSLGLGTDGKNYSAYHGYWPRDLESQNSHFGALADLQTLVDAAHTKGLKVIADYAMNHVHQDSPLWKAHMSDGWFNPLFVSGQQCICGSAVCPWEGAGKEKVCWFASYLPDFNFANTAARNYSVGNAISWMKDKLSTTRLDGFRLDAVKHIELSWLTDLRTQLNTLETSTGQHPYLVGETFTGDQGLIKSFVDPGTMLDGQFDFPLRAKLNSVILLRQSKMQDLAGFMDSNTCYYGNSINVDLHRQPRRAAGDPLRRGVAAVVGRVGGRQGARLDQSAGAADGRQPL